MQVRQLFLSICLLVASFLQATENPPFVPNNQNPAALEESCNLPAPTNFHADAWGTNWVHLTWDLTNPFHAHRINVYTCDEEPVFIKSFLVDAGITETTIFFLQGGLYKFEIKAACTSGDSPNNAWTGCIDIINSGLILDLVVVGNSPEIGLPNCTIPSGGAGHLGNFGRCFFNNAEYSTFRIRQTNWTTNAENFCISRIYNPDKPYEVRFKLDPLEPNSEDPEQYDFLVVDGLGQTYNPDKLDVGIEYQITQYGRVVARFIAYVDDFGESYLQRVNISQGYEIVRISEYTSGMTPGERENADHFTSIIHNTTASPNPFTETLNVQIPKTAASQVHFQILNLSGQKVFDQNLPGGQEQYTLSTANLANGFYLLRIEADGEVQTLKVVKSE